MRGFNIGKVGIIGGIPHAQTTLIEHVTENQLSNNQKMNTKKQTLDAMPTMAETLQVPFMPTYKGSAIWWPSKSQRIKTKRRKAKR